MADEFVLRRRVQFAETDLAGVLHFANYFRFMEEAEHAFWRAIGEGVVTEHDGCRISWPRVSTRCEYFAPVHFEDELDLVLRVVEVGDRSVTYEIEFRREGCRVALGQAKAVCCSMSDGAFGTVPMPKPLREKLEASVAAHGGALKR